MKPEDIIREHMRKIGAKGGKRRLETMSSEERKRIATKASKAAVKARSERQRSESE